MYCSHCGVQVAGHASFCPSCGGAQPGNVSSKQLVRPIQGRKMGGVCLALANYMNLDVTLVRVIWLLLALLPVPGPFVLAYFVCWIVFPAQEETVAPIRTGTADERR
jgi:phage shock protein C